MPETHKVNSQGAANCDRFEALTVGARFQVVSPLRWRCIEVYVKVGPETVQASDGRQWPFAGTEASTCRAILVPDGAYSIAAYDVNYRGPYTARTLEYMRSVGLTPEKQNV